ncbi:hypothetical protein AB6A40_000710 [Gnathostoma spinigerum]|uniref:RING-type E3 ubiquitin transferase n=1 Tax=Gnathostoma spinigerum TaxID=75299 RepID=A0ABD6E3V6_9BILA
MATSRPPVCKFYLSNCCKKGSACPFLHDRSVPPDRTCRFYLAGKCAYGDGCRYDHIKRTSHQPESASRIAIDNSTNHAGCSRLKSPLNSSESRCVDQKINEKGSRDDGRVLTDSKSHDTIKSLMSSLVSKHELSADAAEFIPSTLSVQDSLEHELNRSYADAAGATSHVPLCPYYETGFCERGSECMFVHGDVCDLCNIACLHPNDEEQRSQHRRECIASHEKAMEEAFAEARSRDKTCGICMENIRQRQLRFGILEGCKHCFCIKCIREWRSNQDHDFDMNVVRSCPECRVHSNFVIPAVYWVESKEDKEKLINEYRANMKQKVCKYFSGEGPYEECPFGNKCFYRHEKPDGTVVVGSDPRARHRQPVDRLWDYLVSHRELYGVSLDDSIDNLSEIINECLRRYPN